VNVPVPVLVMPPLPPTVPLRVVLPEPVTVMVLEPRLTGPLAVSEPALVFTVVLPVRLMVPENVLLPETLRRAPLPPAPVPAIETLPSLTVMLFVKARVAPEATVLF